MTDALLPLLITAAVLLAVSGALKLRDPSVAARALVELGVPTARRLVLTGAAVELVVAALLVAWPPAGAPAAAVLYLGFAILVVVQLRRGAGHSCGCFGSAEAPPSRAHVAVDLVFASVCAAALATGSDPLKVLLEPTTGVTILVAAAVTAWLVVTGLELLPGALTAYRKPTG